MIEQYGRHKVKHGDVTHGIADLMGNDKAEIMNSDPPWGGGNIKFWATLNKKMNGVYNEPVTLDALLGAVFGIAQTYVTRYLIIAYGVKWAEEITKAGIRAGFTPRGLVKTRYKGGKTLLPLDVHVFTRGAQPIPQGYFERIAGTVGYTSVKAIVEPLVPIVKAANPNPIILDPCCGMGYTAQTAVDFGLTFRGNELNRKRLDKTVARLK